jgi:hypothetical protein
MIKVVPDLPAAEFLRGLFRSPLKRVATIPVEEKGFKHTGKAGSPKCHPNRGGRPKSAMTAVQRGNGATNTNVNAMRCDRENRHRRYSRRDNRCMKNSDRFQTIFDSTRSLGIIKT